MSDELREIYNRESDTPIAPRAGKRERQKVTPESLAQISSSSLGAAMVAWGVAPAFIERIVTHEAPAALTLTIGGASLLVGAAFLWLPWISTPERRWPLWTAHVLAVMFVIAATMYAVIADTPLAVFPVILAACTMATTWFAIRAQAIPATIAITEREVPEQRRRDWTR